METTTKTQTNAELMPMILEHCCLASHGANGFSVLLHYKYYVRTHGAKLITAKFSESRKHDNSSIAVGGLTFW